MILIAACTLRRYDRFDRAIEKKTSMTNSPVIALAGAGGDLGGRIANALVVRGALVHALVRPGLSPDERRRIEATGARPVSAEPADVVAMAKTCAGATCVVSALNGVRSVMIDRQTVLLEAAVRAGVPRFIPSDYSADFTRTRPGDNRNFDLRREFMAISDKAPIKVTSILNGAFMDMLGREMPIIRRGLRRVLYWHDADQPLDFTTKDDVAAYAAATAMEDATPRILRIAGDTVTARDIAVAMTRATGERYRTLWAGSIAMLGLTIRLTRLLVPQPDFAFSAWQGMQYMRDQFSGRAKLTVLDNGRYPELTWTSVSELLAERGKEVGTSRDGRILPPVR
jgi:nucleoside-diphosphate-sugar epimerase